MLSERNKRLIGKCAMYANKAYEKDIDGIFLEDKTTDCQAFVTTNEKDIIITGQGTTTIKDWMIDFQIYRKRVSYLNDTLVHAGFVKAYDSVREDIHKEVRRLIEEGKYERIVCTGHSLFGAIATIAGLDCSLKYDMPVCCVTFGSPRVGSKEFVKCFNDNIDGSFRCVQNKDPITFTPLPIRFKHVRGGLKVNDKKVSDEVNLYNCCGCRISDHSMVEYCNNLLDVKI
tara:strand:+ start:12143 stop:12829 length:687 start_codon:yes stop_codon:yes gene_type:complete